MADVGQRLGVVVSGGRMFRVIQDRAAETAAAAQLSAFGFRRVAEVMPYSWPNRHHNDLLLSGR